MLVAQLCSTLCDPMDYSSPGSSVHGILQARILECPCCPRVSQESFPAPQFKGIVRYSAFFMVQLSHLYMTIGKAIDLTIWTFVSKVMSLLSNILSRFVIAFFQGTSVF